MTKFEYAVHNGKIILMGFHNTYINGVIANAEDMHELERRLRAGTETATAKIRGNSVFYTTRG